MNNSSEKYKLGFFFGAGAEVGYGLPSGGRFALDIFRQETKEEKDKFTKILKQISIDSSYAENWLPKDFINKNIYTFTKRDFTSLLESTIESDETKDSIIKFLDEFDKKAEEVINKEFDKFGLTKTDVNQKLNKKIGKDITQIDYSNKIEIKSALQAETKLFESKYFGALLEIYIQSNQEENTLLSKVIESFLQLLVGCYGSKLTSDLNEIFIGDLQLPLLRDFYGLFSIDLSRAGLTAFNLVLDKKLKDKSLNKDSTVEDIFEKLGFKILELLLEKTLNYKQLVDSHFRYLYNPKIEWSKFSKMVLFLETVRTYIEQYMKEARQKKDGYYHDLLGEIENIDITSIGTTNYTNLISSIIPDNIKSAYLNGSIDDFYDPYLNKIIKFKSEEERLKHPHITIPFIFTQSGIKPLTSIEMSRRYVDLYDQFCDSEAIVVVGYGFNDDDGHINGLFRDLIQEKEKELFIIRRQNSKSKEKIKEECEKNLRIDPTDKLHIILVNDKDRKDDNVLWCDKVTKILH